MAIDEMQPHRRPRRHEHWHLWMLLVITLFGAWLRFAFITRPPMWGDEGYTYSRICGPFRDMLDVLQFDGFVPLHYELYWLMGRFIRLTPFVMRFVPALSGTLMIPAMYFLAVQISSRRTALLTAAFTCCSAFMMVYSHDAKMYPHFWLFCMLSVGCLLLWLRTRQRIAWLAWVASTLAAVGLHPSGMILLAVELLIFITHRRAFNVLVIVMFLIGLAIPAAGPAGYYAGFNRWSQRVDENGWGGSGINWVAPYNRGRTGEDLLLFTTTAYLFSWEWPGHWRPGTMAPWINHWLASIGIIILLLVGVGMMPWRGRARSRSRPWRGRARGRPGLGGRKLARPQRGWGAAGIAREVWWRQFIWLGMWIVLPAYGFYCASMPNFVKPSDWVDSASALVDGHWVLMAIEIAFVLAVSFAWRPLPRYIAATLAIAAALTFNVLLVHGGWQYETSWRGFFRAGAWGVALRWLWHKYWYVLAAQVVGLAWMVLIRRPIARYVTLAVALVAFVMMDAGLARDGLANLGDVAWTTGARWLDLASDPLALAGLCAVLPAIAIFYSGPTLCVRCSRTLIFVAVVLAAWGLCWAIYSVNMHRFHQFCAIQTQVEKLENPNRYGSAGPSPDQARRDELHVEQVIWNTKWESKWMPRYIAVAWPAFAIALCALLLRLPTRPLRWSAIALVFAVNITQTCGRLFADTEPPMDRIVHDALAAQTERFGKPIQTQTRTYLNFSADAVMGHPGGLFYFNNPMKYYTAIFWPRPDQRLTPRLFRSMAPIPQMASFVFGAQFLMRYDDSDIRRDVRSHPNIRHVIVWDSFAAPAQWRNGPPWPQKDPLAALMGPDWRLQDQQTYILRLHWMWMDLQTLRRREFIKLPGGR